MRRVFATLVMVSVVALGAAACGSSDDSGSGSAAGGAPSPSAVAGGATATACQEALAASETGAKAFGDDFDEMQKMILAIAADGDDADIEAKGTALEAKMHADLKTWSDKLTALAGQDVDAKVKTALTEAATTVTKINDPNDETAGDAARTTLTGVADKIKTACA